MLYLSQLLGRPVREVEGDPVATIKDVIVRLGEDHPPVTGIVARYRLAGPAGRYRRRDIVFARANTTRLDEHGVWLNTDAPKLSKFTPREGEVLLVRAVLDKQLIVVDAHD